MKVLLAAVPLAILGSVVTIPVLLAGGDPPPLVACAPNAASLEQTLATIRALESGGDYAARAAGSTASGAYQFIDSTWDGYAGYPVAADAPPDIQDAKAAEMVGAILEEHGSRYDPFRMGILVSVHVGETDDVKHFFDSTVRDNTGRRERAEMVAPGTLGVHGLCLEQGTEFAERCGVEMQASAIQDCGATRGPVEAQNHAHRGRLACAVRPEKARDDARFNCEGEVVDSGGCAVALGEVGDFDHGSIVTEHICSHIVWTQALDVLQPQ